MKKEIKIGTVNWINWAEDQCYYRLPSKCKKILEVWVDNKPVKWKIVQFLVVYCPGEGKKLKVKYENSSKDKNRRENY